MDENADDTSPTGRAAGTQRWARWARPAAIGAAGLVAGGLLAGSLTASATDSTATDDGTASSGTAATDRPDPSQPQRADEELLTGNTASKVEAAALAEYPGATVVRIESDSDGVYEAHLTTAAGEQVTVEVGKDFEVTGTEAHGGPGGGRGDHGEASGETGATGAGWST